jgi:uncharacterized damage-inducible protein DinB
MLVGDNRPSKISGDGGGLVMTDRPTDAAAARTALLDRVQREWDALREIVGGLDERQLSAPAGPDGWAIKDHLGHLAHWEEYLLSVLEGRDPLVALGLPADQEQQEDAVNLALQRRDAGRPAGELSRLLAETHARVVARLEALDDVELERRRKVIGGNTDEHFAEHRAWIRELLGTAGSAD